MVHYGVLWECHSTHSRNMNRQNPPWYSSLKSTALFSPHIHKPFSSDPFLPIFPSKICSRLPSLPCMPHSLPIIPLLSDTLQSHKHYKSSNSTLCLFFLPFPLSSVQTLFPSLCSQTEPAYKWQIALRSITSLFFMFFTPCISLQFILQPTK